MHRHFIRYSDLEDHFLLSPDGLTAVQSKDGNTWRRLQVQNINDDIAIFKSYDGGSTWPEVKTLLTNTDIKYQIIDMAGADAVAIPPGRWCANNALVNGELGAWYVETVEFDNSYRTVTAYPYSGVKRYYYFAKMDHGVWQGWEKYVSAV